MPSLKSSGRRSAFVFGLAARALACDTGEPAGVDPVTIAAPLPLVRPPFDVGSTSAAIDRWPLLLTGVRTRSVSSFDRTGGNEDGYTRAYSELYSIGGEHVAFDEIGPGVLRTIWFAPDTEGGALDLGMVRFYFDDDATPRIAVEANALFAGHTPPFQAELVATSATSTGGYVSWTPLPFRRRLRITTEKKPSYYQVHYDVVPPDWDVASFAVGTRDADLATTFAHAGVPSSLPLEEIPLDASRVGEGTIDVLRFVPDAPPTDGQLAGARLRVWFDGEASPQVDVPLGFFFGSGRGLAEVRAVPWTMEPSLFESRLPMPFWQQVRIALTGLSGRLSIHVGPKRWAREEAGTLEVRFHEEAPTSPGRDFTYADVHGVGKLVATVLDVDPERADNDSWWEGDLRSSVDGARSPSIHGTGHEDDHLGGYSNLFLARPFTLPLHGEPRSDPYPRPADLLKNAAATMYRVWPGISFERSLLHTTEHGSENSVNAHYAAATFLYRRPSEGMTLTDAFDVGDAAAADTHAYSAPGRSESLVYSAFAGGGPKALSALLHRYVEAATFALAIAPANDGVMIRRAYDTSQPDDLDLEVDGVHVTEVWTTSPSAPYRRWIERDVFVPPQLTRDKALLRIRIVPKGSGSASAARFEAWSVLRATSPR